MTHSTINIEDESGGSVRSYYHTIDITSLDTAGVEDYSPGATFGGLGVYGVAVVGQEPADLFIRWDHVNEQLHVTDASDGTTVAQGTDVGEVVLRVDGK
jgi:hypothetical protein